MQDSFKNLVTPAKSILVLLPTNPNFDQVAAGTSLYLALKELEGKEVNVYSASPMVVEYNRLIGVNKVKNELGNKNLAISFENYDPQGIEKVSWDIDNGKFKLTIVPKINIAPPSQDQVNITYAGVAADLVIMVGGSSEDDFPAIKTQDLAKVKLIHIGVNDLNIAGRDKVSLAAPASSISEVTANLIKGGQFKIEGDIATNLLMGIEDATNKFSIPEVTADTFSLVAELMRAGGKRLAQGQVQAQDFPQGAIPGMPSQVPSSWTEPKIFKGTSVS